MAAQKFLLACLVFLIFAMNQSPADAQGLKVGFYAHSCPKAEAIVGDIMNYTLTVARSLAGPLLRMHFHDCFVRGCEGSVLLNSTNGKAEKNAIPNLSLRGFQIIDKIKTALEKECPKVVSCADILALVARDSVVGTSGQYYEVETGRRDGRVSVDTEALQNLLPPFANITVLKAGFAAKGLSVKDLVVLSGGHTIGTSHCSSFANRLYNFTGRGDADPTLDSEYADRLRKKCTPATINTQLAELDPGSFKTFDVNYFTLLAKRRGLLESDNALLNDPETKAYVISHSSAAGTASFFKDFAVSMINMGRIGVLTGNQGEIRDKCSKPN